MTTDELHALLSLQLVRYPQDQEALDRVCASLGLPALQLKRAGFGSPPAVSLPLRIQPAKACALGWSSELYSLTVLISNACLRQSDGALVAKGRGPVVAVCAEYGRPLLSLEPPGLAEYELDSARAVGVPMVRLPGGFLRSPLRLETSSREARAPVGRDQAVLRAEQFFDDLEGAWPEQVGPVLEVAWPVYHADRKGPPLDAVVGMPLPELELR